MTEVAWFSEPPEAMVKWSKPEELGHLHFIDPNGERAVVPVTTGPTRGPESGSEMIVWHVDMTGAIGDIITVSPSIHFVGKWHSPNPVQFKLVEELSN